MSDGLSEESSGAAVTNERDVKLLYCYGRRVYNRHGVFDTNRLRHIIYTPLPAN